MAGFPVRGPSPRHRAGGHARRDDVVLVRGREVRITGEAVEIDADGEVHEGWTDQTWRVDPGAWSIIAPR